MTTTKVRLGLGLAAAAAVAAALFVSLTAYAASGTFTDFAVFGAGNAADSNTTSLGANVTVSNGLVGGNRQISLGANGTYDGVQSGKTAAVGANTTTGGLTQNAASLALPAPTAFAASSSASGDRTAPANGTITLAPGIYRNLTLGSIATLNLSAGTYVFNTITGGPNAAININVSAGSVTILAAGNVSFDSNAHVTVSGGSAQKVYLETRGTFTTGPNAIWQGTVYSTKAAAPGANGISLGDNTVATGAFYSNQQVEIGNNSIITFSLAAALTPPTVEACLPTGTSSFEDFTNGSVNGQGGWQVANPAFDQAVVSNVYGYPTFGCKSLRISDSVNSGSFGDQIFSPSVANEAGEASAANGGKSGGTRQNHFEAQFDLASAMSSLQPGMHLSVSPDRGDGSRMSYLRFEDQADGIHVYFDDVPGGQASIGTAGEFAEEDIATVSRGPHTIKFDMTFVDGPSNDIVKIYIDGALVKTGTSWEDYYRFDPEQAGNGNQVPTVDSLLFRESGTANPADAGKGFLIDNFSASSDTVAGSIDIAKYACPAGTTVTRAANGVNGAAPAGCVPMAGATFGYAHGTQTDANAPFPELAAPLTAAGATDGNGSLTIGNLAASGRYLIAETDAGNQQLAASKTLGLYCEGDGDTSGTNDNQELTFVAPGGVAHCVAYDPAVDTTAPVVTVVPVAGSLLSGTETFTITVTDDQPLDLSKLSHIWSYLYDTAAPQASRGANVAFAATADPKVATGTLTVDTTQLADGDASLDVGRLQDAAGNYSGASDTYFKNYVIDNAPSGPAGDTAAPTVPGPITLTNPSLSCGATTDSNTLTVNWGASTDDSGPVTYQYWVTTPGAHNAGNPYIENGLTGTSRDGAFTEGEGLYTIKVAAVDAAGNMSAFSAPCTVTYSTTAPAPDAAPSVPTLLSPSNGATTNTNEFDFTWNPSTDANGGPITYQFQSSMDPTSVGGVLQNGLWVSPTPLTTPMIHSTGAPDGTWYWQVRAQDEDGNWSGWSDIWSVKLDTSAPAPATPGVTTNDADAISQTDAALHGTVGSVDAEGESFWVSTTTFDTSSPNIPANVYSTPVLGGLSAGASFSDALSLVTTQGIVTGGAPGNMPAITPNTTYYYAAWAQIGGTWYPGEVKTLTTGASAPAGHAPTASDSNVTLNENTPTDIQLTANDPDGNPLTYSVVDSPAHGTVTVAGSIATYTPAADYFGGDSFTFKANDGSADSNTATILITVNEVAPAAHTITASAGANGSITPSGAVSVTDGGDQAFTITPDAGFHVADVLVDSASVGAVTSYTFSANDADHTISATFEADAQVQSLTTSSRRSGGSGRILGATTGPGEVLGAETGPGECAPLLTSFMRLGANNDQGQVKLLQAFLSGQAGATVPVTGLFDAQTDTAVRAFQAKYADEILAPWGLSQPTGWVYKLTQWKINALACSTLDAPKPDVQPLGQGGAGDATVASAATASVAGSVTLSNTADDSAVGGAGDATQTAAAANASSTQGWFGSFVGWLFGK